MLLHRCCECPAISTGNIFNVLEIIFLCDFAKNNAVPEQLLKCMTYCLIYCVTHTYIQCKMLQSARLESEFSEVNSQMFSGSVLKKCACFVKLYLYQVNIKLRSYEYYQLLRQVTFQDSISPPVLMWRTRSNDGFVQV